MILLIIWIVLSGLVIGALGRLVIPGPNPMSIGMTIVVGIGGSFLGGLIGNLLFGRPGGFILAVLCAAGIPKPSEPLSGGRRTQHGDHLPAPCDLDPLARLGPAKPLAGVLPQLAHPDPLHVYTW